MPAGDPRLFQFDLPGSGRPDWFALPEPYYPGARWYSENRASARSFHPIEGIRAVVIHATAGWSSADAMNHWKTPGVQASAHWIVPDENEEAHGQYVWAVVDESLASWHVNNSRSHPDVWDNHTRINHWSLGIEIVNTQDVEEYSDPYSDWQIRTTALIARRCWARYPNLRHIVSHAKLDPARRADPGRQFPWDKFRTYILDDSHDPTPDPRSLTVPAPVSGGPALRGADCCMAAS